MRKHLYVAAVLGLFGSLLMAQDASACHRRNRGCNTGCQTAVAAPCGQTTCAPRQRCGHHGRRGGGFGHHRRQTCGTCGSSYGGYGYGAPVAYAAPQAMGSLQAPAKQMP